MKAKVGDIIKAYDFEDTSGSRSGYYIGVVENLVQSEGVEKVEYRATTRVEVNGYSGDPEQVNLVDDKFRIVQNGIKTTFGKTTRYIQICQN